MRGTRQRALACRNRLETQHRQQITGLPALHSQQQWQHSSCRWCAAHAVVSLPSIILACASVPALQTSWECSRERSSVLLLLQLMALVQA